MEVPPPPAGRGLRHLCCSPIYARDPVHRGASRPTTCTRAHGDFIYAPPQPLHLFHEGSFVGPFVYGLQVQAQHGDSASASIRRRHARSRSRSASSARGDAYEFWGADRRPTSISSARPKDGTLFLLGTDRLGRDMFSRIVYGARISLTIGLVGIALSASRSASSSAASPATTAAGSTTSSSASSSDPALPASCRCGWRSRRRCRSTWSPILVYFGITIILGLLDWTGLARAVRSKLLALREEDFVHGRRLMGATPAPHHRPPSAAELHEPPHRLGDALDPVDDPRRDRAVVPRPRPAAADHQLGRAAQRGAEHQRRSRSIPG